jgi:hypothetical protein
MVGNHSPLLRYPLRDQALVVLALFSSVVLGLGYLLEEVEGPMVETRVLYSLYLLPSQGP